MSSFKRRGQPSQPTPALGTRPSPSNPSVFTLSTGSPSLDDLLGGGLPLGHVLVVLTPDPHTAYGDLVQRYFVAQGLASGQRVCILDDSAIDIASGCMWTGQKTTEVDEVAPEDSEQSQIKIAWRYENMRQFRTSKHIDPADDAYCCPLDLTCRIPETVVETAVSSKQLSCLPVSSSTSGCSFAAAAARLNEILWEGKGEADAGSDIPLRLSIPSLGSPQWGDVSHTAILRFLHVLRARLRAAPRAAALVTLPSYLADDNWGGPGWSQKVGRLVDGCITLQAFSSDPALTSMFPSHHGLVSIHTLPSPCSLVPPSDKFSQLRGLSTFSSSSTGGGENNLAFKCTRKRFVIETLHLDVEGGVSERRTTVPVSTAAAPKAPESRGSAAAIEISVPAPVMEQPPVGAATKKKTKKKVAFQSDRPDLYDF